MPVLATIDEDFRDRGLTVATICVLSSSEETWEALQETNNNLLTLVDENGETMSPYHVVSTPITYLIGSDGVIQMASWGWRGHTEQDLRTEIERLLE